MNRIVRFRENQRSATLRVEPKGLMKGSSPMHTYLPGVHPLELQPDEGLCRLVGVRGRVGEIMLALTQLLLMAVHGGEEALAQGVLDDALLVLVEGRLAAEARQAPHQVVAARRVLRT